MIFAVSHASTAVRVCTWCPAPQTQVSNPSKHVRRPKTWARCARATCRQAAQQPLNSRGSRATRPCDLLERRPVLPVVLILGLHGGLPEPLLLKLGLGRWHNSKTSRRLLQRARISALALTSADFWRAARAQTRWPDRVRQRKQRCPPHNMCPQKLSGDLLDIYELFVNKSICWKTRQPGTIAKYSRPLLARIGHATYYARIASHASARC